MEPQDTHFQLMAHGRKLNLREPVVMGILNITPDSFYDGGRYDNPDAALAHTERMLIEGAKIIDIGAFSSRPGSIAPSLEEEWQRLAHILPVLRKRFPQTWLSIDTYRAEIVRRAAAEGVDLINDISAGSVDDEMLSAVIAAGLPYILMHMQGTPDTMQQNPNYADVVAEVSNWFDTQVEALQKQGCTQLILDPGFGFGKTVEHNYSLLTALPQFLAKGFPVLVGISRKSMITKLLNIKKEAALNAGTVLHTYALMKGAHIIRTHDVREAVEVIAISEYIHSLQVQ